VCASPASPEPFRIEPIFSPRLWGSRCLAPLFPEKTNLAEPIGEAWLTGVDCKIANGQFAGKTLGEAWPNMTIGWKGSKFQSEADFPLLLKFIFPKDKLSIQVHPDDAYAAEHERAAGGRGKTEMWYIVSAEPGARLLAGLRPGTTKEAFCAALANNTLEEIFQSYDVQRGDTFFIPAGTPHTIGPNMIVCEVQEYSDLTYRVYDYGRADASGKSRELHVKKALDVISFDSATVAKAATHATVIRGSKIWEQLIDCKYFSATKFMVDERMHLKGLEPSEQFKVWVFLEGNGKIAWTSVEHFGKSYGGEFAYKQGDCWFLPAEFCSHSFYPQEKTSVLMATPGNPKVSQKSSDAD
jgi:mannose-6-phosphate isomerase